MKDGYVYIMTNKSKNVFYVGVTNDIARRTYEHKIGEGSVFTSKYKCNILVYYEHFERITDAIVREKQLKNWHREWKINLVRRINPEMNDLAFTELGFEESDFETEDK